MFHQMLFLDASEVRDIEWPFNPQPPPLLTKAFSEENFYTSSKFLRHVFQGVVKQGPSTCRSKRYVGTFIASL